MRLSLFRFVIVIPTRRNWRHNIPAAHTWENICWKFLNSASAYPKEVQMGNWVSFWPPCVMLKQRLPFCWLCMEGELLYQQKQCKLPLLHCMIRCKEFWSETSNFLFCISAFLCIFQKNMMKNPHTPNLTWIGSWWPEIWPHEYLISPIEISVNWPGETRSV